MPSRLALSQAVPSQDNQIKAGQKSFPKTSDYSKNRTFISQSPVEELKTLCYFYDLAYYNS